MAKKTVKALAKDDAEVVTPTTDEAVALLKRLIFVEHADELATLKAAAMAWLGKLK